MAAMASPKKSKVVGQHVPWTEAELDALSIVTDEDKAAARAMWRRQAPRSAKRLLDAKPRKRKA